jgi:DNA-binding MarR family transcriptional regulator
MKDVAELQRQSFGHTLFLCARLLDEIAQARINREAGRRVMRPALTRILPHLRADGVRVTDLARAADVSKQAVSQAIGALEAEGIVELRADPADARAKRVHLTKRGGEAFAHGLGVLAGLERELEAELGPRLLEQTRRGLAAMQPVLERWRSAPHDEPRPKRSRPPR